MPAKPSGEIKTKIIHQPQKNGDIYVLERQTIYDPVKKYNKVLSSKLIGKIGSSAFISKTMVFCTSVWPRVTQFHSDHT